MTIPVVDIFAGPGGLSEGFSAFEPERGSKQRPFRVVVSAEMETNAARTLRLRAFFRQFPPGHVPASYYNYVSGRSQAPWTSKNKAQWDAACGEALQLKLGEPSHDEYLQERIRALTSPSKPWVLIGGPPCQAFSLVGRSRNRGIAGYKAEEDQRHFLYKHYLKILAESQPAAFVMENVKGLLSSRVGGELMFPKILSDLRAPSKKAGGPKYRIVPLVNPIGNPSGEPHAKDYLLKAEELGIPQARHRVVLLGLREDIGSNCGQSLHPTTETMTVSDAIAGLPPLRSGVTDAIIDDWFGTAREILQHTARVSGHPEVARLLNKLSSSLKKKDPGTGGKWISGVDQNSSMPRQLRSWFSDSKLDGILNHECREHMTSDLMRYAYVSAFARVHGRSPRGPDEFPTALHPNHKNWISDQKKFIDRFKAQAWESPSSTITSHLSKDGHYFVHPDPSQLRSLSVREAARLQTFPDNYYFVGSRGAQFRQVGNAVPPLMALKIAGVVHSYLKS